MLNILFLSQFLWAQPSLPSLEGHWIQPCQTQATREEAFHGQDVTLSENYFYKPDCSQPLMTIGNLGTFTIDGQNMDFTYQKVTITLKDDLMIQDFNSRTVCGFYDWKLNEERDVTGLRCAIITGGKALQMATPGNKRFGIYKIEGDLLYFGRLEPDHDALSPEKRPITFDPRYYIKQ